MSPWNNWVHCTGSTYGSWLRGDPRGCRARHHREHVEGDYKNRPPPGAYDELFQRSKSLMKRTGVRLSWEARVHACRTMVEALRFHHVDVQDLCVGANHWPALARFYPVDSETWRIIQLEGRSQKRDPKHLLGIAK